MLYKTKMINLIEKLYHSNKQLNVTHCTELMYLFQTSLTNTRFTIDTGFFTSTGINCYVKDTVSKQMYEIMITKKKVGNA